MAKLTVQTHAEAQNLWHLHQALKHLDALLFVTETLDSERQDIYIQLLELKQRMPSILLVDEISDETG